MPLSEPSAKIQEFIGLNNKSEPRTMVPGELTKADNVDLDDRKRLRRRRGSDLALALSNLASTWATPDESRLFAIADGVLYEIVGDHGSLGAIELATGLDDGETYWDWDTSRIFVSNDAVDLVIDGRDAYPLAIPKPNAPVVSVGDGSLSAGRYLVAVVLEDSRGRQGGASSIVQVDLEDDSALIVEPQAVPSAFTARIYASRANDTVVRQLPLQVAIYEDISQLGAVLEEPQYSGHDPFPGGPIAYHAGRLWKGVRGAFGESTGLVSSSFPFWPHLFEYGPGDFMVNGRVVALSDVQQAALLVGTDRGIWRHSLDEGLVQVADYGMVPGRQITKTRDEMAYFWTQHGICRAFPFEELTDQAVSAPPGARCSVGLVEHAGFARIVAMTSLDGGDGDSADNPR